MGIRHFLFGHRSKRSVSNKQQVDDAITTAKAFFDTLDREVTEFYSVNSKARGGLKSRGVHSWQYTRAKNQFNEALKAARAKNDSL